MLQRHLLTFEQEWTDKSDGRTLPGFVTDELHDFMGCGSCTAACPAHTITLQHQECNQMTAMLDELLVSDGGAP